MIRMTNISKQESIIHCDYSPEDSQDTGFLAVNIITEEIVELKKTKYDEDSDRYSAKVKLRLIDIAQNGKIPEKSNIVWG